MAKSHLDRKKVKRQGWFDKEESGMPQRDYRASTSKGFKGTEWDAHHLIPATSLKKSAGEFKGEKKRYIDDVKYITPWVINKSGNMLGMPQFRSYLFYYQNQDAEIDDDDPELRAENNAKVKRYVKTFNKYAQALRKKYGDLRGKNPEGYPIHRPTSWGHTKYDKDVKGDLKTQVWDPLDEAKKEHETDAETVAGQLDAMSAFLKQVLEAQGQDTSRARWDRRYDPNDTTWYQPFTMADTGKNPLFG